MTSVVTQVVHCEDAKDEFIAIRPCEVGGHIGVMLKQGHREIRIPFDLVGEVVTNIQRTVNDCADGQQALEMLKELDLPGIDYMTVGLQMSNKFPEVPEKLDSLCSACNKRRGKFREDAGDYVCDRCFGES